MIDHAPSTALAELSRYFAAGPAQRHTVWLGEDVPYVPELSGHATGSPHGNEEQESETESQETQASLIYGRLIRGDNAINNFAG